MTVLDAVAWVQRHEAFDLAYRFSCRVGMCGTCAMVINGRERWACRTLIANLRADVVTLDPLRNLPLVKDLVVDMKPFFAKMTSAMGHFVPAAEVDPDSANPPALPKERGTIDSHIECISCGACYSACTMIRWDPAYLGPAALNRAATLVMDSRDQAQDARLSAVTGAHGCWQCHSQFTCTDVCPMHVRPSESIGYLKRQAIRRLLAIAPAPDSQESIDSPPSIDSTGHPNAPELVLETPGMWASLASFADLFRRPVACAALVSILAGAMYLVGLRANAAVPLPDFVVQQDSVEPAMLAGALAFEEAGCLDCHSVLGVGGRQARDLWNAGKRHDRDWLRRLLNDPDSLLPEGTMPQFVLNDQEMTALVDYVSALDFSYRAPGRVSRSVARGGGEIYRSGCLNCHRADGSSPDAVSFAREGSQRNVEWLKAYLASPDFHHDKPGIRPFGGERTADIALYLSLQK